MTTQTSSTRHQNLDLSAETRVVVSRMEHLALSAADLDRSVAFYRDVLGFEVRFDETAEYGRCAHVGTDRFYLAINAKPGVDPAARSAGRAQIYHFGFTTENLPELRRRLDRAGVAIADEADRTEGYAIYFADPDGHEIEVVEYRATYRYR